jgi:hypothetical protein
MQQPTKKRYLAFEEILIMCSCGYAIDQGFPCRHFWKRFTTNDMSIFVGFSMELINEIWLNRGLAC